LKITTSSHGLRPAGLLRAAWLARSSPLISDAFSFGRKDSQGTIAAIATSAGSDQRNPIAPSHPLPVVKFKEILLNLICRPCGRGIFRGALMHVNRGYAYQ
jgi:hypothetical protein